MAGESPARRAREKSAQIRQAEEAKARTRRILTQVVVVFVLAVVAIGGTIAVLKIQNDKDEITGPIVAPTAVNENGGIYVGDLDADVTVTIVEDFQCPACRSFETMSSDLLTAWAAEDSGVRLEYRPIAFLDRASSTEYSSRAANAAFCVANQGPSYFLAFHNMLFENQPAEGTAGLPDDDIIGLAMLTGVNESSIGTCIRERTHDGWIQQQTREVLKEVDGTPTVFVNDEMLTNPTPARLTAAVEAAK